VIRIRSASIAWAWLVCASVLFGREWTDSSGKFRVEAKLVTVKDQKVYLEKATGVVTAVPLARLSRSDLEYLASLPEYREYFQKNPIPGLTRPTPPIDMATIHVDDESTVGEIRRFPDMGWSVKSLAFSPDGRFLAVGKMDRAVMVYDVDTSQRVGFHKDLEELSQVLSLAFTPDGKKLLAGGSDGLIQVWNVAPNGALTPWGRFVGHSGEVLTITVSADAKYVLSGGGEKKMRYWSLEDWRERFSVDGFKGKVKASFLTRSGRQGLGCDGESIVLIDIQRGQITQKMKLVGPWEDPAIAPDGSRVAVAHAYSIRLWDIRSGQEYQRMEDPDLQVPPVFSPNGRYLLASSGHKVNVWEVATQRKLYEFDAHETFDMEILAYSPDRRHFAAIAECAGQDLRVFRLPAELAAE